MAGCFGKLFKRRGKSLPPGGTQAGKNAKNDKNKKSNVNVSMPNLSDQIKQAKQQATEDALHNIKEIPSEVVDSKSYKSEERLDNNLIVPAPISFRESKSNDTDDDFDSKSSESVSKEESNRQQDIEFLNELNRDLQNELRLSLSKRSTREFDEPKSGASLNLSPRGSDSKLPPSARSTMKQIGALPPPEQFQQPPPAFSPNTTGGSSLKKTNPIQMSVTFKDDESNFMLPSASNPLIEQNTISIENIQKLVENLNIEKSLIEDLKSDNKNLNKALDGIKLELLERERKYKQENDLLIATVHNTLAKDMRTDAERDALTKLFLSRQQEANDKLIKEQKKMIEQFKLKCDNYEKELNKPSSIEADLYQRESREQKEEISILRNIIHRLNIELSAYQAKFPSPMLQSSLKKKEMSGLPNKGPIPVWLVNSKYLSPLLASYDEKISEKNEKIKLLKKKIDDLTNKFKSILDENGHLREKIDKGLIATGDFDTSDLSKIKHHALLVLEENKMLTEQLEFQKMKLIETQKQHIFEVGNLSKRIIVNDSEKNELKNQNESLKLNNDELLRKYNDLLADSQRKVSLQDHLSQTGELKRKMDETNILHKHELEHTYSIIQTLEEEKKEFAIKNSNLKSENSKLLAENQVLDKALNEGIGRKTQRKIKELEKKIELAEIKEKTAYSLLDKVAKEAENFKLEKEAYENIAKENEMNLKKNENKLAEEHLKFSKIENKFQDYKEKSAAKIADILHKLKYKDSEFVMVKLENEKKVSDILNLLQKKQDQIDDLIKDKRQMEGELEMVWQSTQAENKRIKETLLDLKYIKPDQISWGSAHHKLLLDD